MADEAVVQLGHITFYLPIHNNLSQVEHTAAFLTYPGVSSKVVGGSRNSSRKSA